jgi:hypothetical protein
MLETMNNASKPKHDADECCVKLIGESNKQRALQHLIMMLLGSIQIEARLLVRAQKASTG